MSKAVIIDRDKLAEAANRIRLAEHVYTPDQPPPEGWRLVDSSTTIFPADTGFFAALYQREKLVRGEARYIMAFRGADNLHDLSSLFSVLACRVPKQYGLALAFIDHVQRRHMVAPQDMEMTGHSLGGYLARAAGGNLGVRKVWIFNSPGPTVRDKEKLTEYAPVKLPHDAVIHIRSAHDVISKWGYDDGIVIDLETKDDHHALSGLHRAMQGVVEGRDIPVVPSSGNVLAMAGSAAFNYVSQQVCQSPPLQKFMRGLFGCGYNKNK